MIGDLQTMLWKEYRSLVSARSRRQIVLLATFAVIYVVLFPIEAGAGWVTDAVLLGILAIVLPTVVVGLIVPDAFAGERERHTLTTLLASRMPDRAILYGKLGFGVAVGWLSLPVELALSLFVVNVTARSADLLLYDPGLLISLLMLGLLVALLTGTIAIFVSLRAHTAQEAQQLTLVGLMTPFMVVGFALTLLVANRDTASMVGQLLGQIQPDYVAVGCMAVLALIDALLIGAVDRRFRRGRLISG